MSVTNILQGVGGFGSDEELWGRKVKVPEYADILKSQKDAIKANKSALPDILDISKSINSFNREEIEKMLEMTIPDYEAQKGQASKNNLSMMRGEIPDDVSDAVLRKSAERAIAGGFSGSGMHRSLEARDLGLTSLSIMDRGMDSAARWIQQSASMVPLHDATSMFISPAQKFAADVGKFERDLFAATVDAAPDPAKRGQFDTELAIVGMALSAYGGGPGYTQTHQPPQYGGGGGGYGQQGGGGGWGWGGGGGGGGGNYIPPPDYSSNNVGGWSNDNGGMPFV